MSYTNGTTHYNLPLTTGADKRDWSDTNQAFSDVDAALYGAVQDTAQAELDIDSLETRMDTAEQNISTNTGNIAGLDTRLTTAEGAITSQGAQITDTRQDLEDMICAYNEASATSTHVYAIGDYFIYNDVLYKATQAIAIGDTIVPDTNCATTNVTTELLATEDLSGDVTDLQTDVGQLQTDVGQLQTDITTLKNDAKTRTLGTITNPAGATYGSDVERIRAFINDNDLNDYLNHLMFLIGPSPFKYGYTGAPGISYTSVYLEASNPAIQTLVFTSSSANLYGWFGGSSLTDETNLTHSNETTTTVFWI